MPRDYQYLLAQTRLRIAPDQYANCGPARTVGNIRAGVGLGETRVAFRHLILRLLRRHDAGARDAWRN